MPRDQLAPVIYRRAQASRAGRLARKSTRHLPEALRYVIAGWAIFTGVLAIMTAISLGREIDNEWIMILGGALSVLFGVLLAFLPGVGLLSLTWLIGLYALIFGVAFIILGFRVRGHGAASRVS